VEILKHNTTLSPFPARRAYEAHGLAAGADFAAYADDIAQEILWWGSHDVHRQGGINLGWREIVADTAAEIGVEKKRRGMKDPAWKIENAIFEKVMKDWENLSPKQREEMLRKAGGNTSAARGFAFAAIGGAVRAGGPDVLALAVGGVAGAVLAPVAAVVGLVGAGWAAYDLAGPGYRVLRPITLSVALTRRRLRDQRAASVFGD
jgi:hypothetical protein